MKSHARVVVIGGGVVGVSTLYHLAKFGCTDAVLLERSELTAGSTWHAAGLLPLFNMSYTVGQLHKYSVDLYKRLPAETGQDVSFHVTGNLRLATCRDRMDEYRKYCGTANTIGVPFEIIGPDAVKALWPLVELGDGRDTAKIVGALYHPDDGHIAPADLTMALRRAARSAGAEIHEHTEVTAAAADRERRMAIDDQSRRDRRRARRLRHRQLRAADRSPVRPRRAGDSRRAPVHRLRRVAGAQGLPQRWRSRARRAARIRPVVLPARGTARLDPRPVRDRRAGTLRGRRAGLVRQGPVPGRPRAAAAPRRGRAAARAGARALRHQGHRQRSDFLHAGWQPADRAGLERCATSGSTRATASASRQQAVRAGSSPSGSSRASPASTCSPSIRVASGRTRASATSSPRTRRPTATSSRSTSRTRNATTRVP